jgi:hypothetical protein
MLMPGLQAQPVIPFAVGWRRVTMTDCSEQSAIVDSPTTWWSPWREVETS